MNEIEYKEIDSYDYAASYKIATSLIFIGVLLLISVVAFGSESPQRDLLKADLRDDCMNNRNARLYQRLAAQKGEGDGVRLAREGGIIIMKHYSNDMNGIWK